MYVDLFSKGKNDPRNEDAAGYNRTTWVVCDGSTDKYERQFNGKRGGELAAQLVLDEALKCSLNGEALVEHLSNKLARLYPKLNPQAIDDSQARFATTLVCARKKGKNLVVTQVGDTTFRINGKQIYYNNKDIDILTSQLRVHYIELTNDIDGSREFILPLLQSQLVYSNNCQHPLGYGAIDGSKVPPQFVRKFEFPLESLKTLEIFTDGYYDVPNMADIKAYEALHAQIEQDDPYKCQTHASTKASDDRTVMIVRF